MLRGLFQLFGLYQDAKVQIAIIDPHGLHMTVNKNDSQLAAAALNFYPNGKSFSGNYGRAAQ